MDLPVRFKDKLDEFTRALKNIYGDRLISIALYGSAASGEFVNEHSNINLAVVLSDTSLESLGKISGIINSGKWRLFNPVFFTEDYIRASQDVFPIEFLDMKENHVLLYGRDLFSGLAIDLKNLRFQCEQELKAKLVNIKGLYLRNKDKGALKKILFRAFTSTMHILRNLVRLKGKAPGYRKEDILKDIEREFRIETSAFYKILSAKNRNKRLTYKETASLFSGFVLTLENIVALVDRL